jgi:hypothetical protein
MVLIKEDIFFGATLSAVKNLYRRVGQNPIIYVPTCNCFVGDNYQYLENDLV